MLERPHAIGQCKPFSPVDRVYAGKRLRADESGRAVVRDDECAALGFRAGKMRIQIQDDQSGTVLPA